MWRRGSTSRSVLLTFVAFVVSTCSCVQTPSTETKFRLASYYSNHMVLQRAPARAVVWGFAPFGDTVTLTLSLNNKTFTAPVNSEDPLTGEGVWSLLLDPLPAFTTMSITADLTSKSQPSITLDDIIFGDVWICSGQSNMRFQLSQVLNASDHFATAAEYPNIRVMAVKMVFSTTPLNDLRGMYETWQRSSPESLGQNGTVRQVFSGVCWLYAKYIYKFVETPLGMIQSTWGGTPVRAWSPPDVNELCGEPIPTSMRTPPHTAAANSMSKLSYRFLKSQSEKAKVNHRTASVLWNAMIRPLRNMTIFGAIWYQGEADAKDPERYHCTFPAMIDAWRREFSQASSQTNPSFPFGFVQLGTIKNPNTIGGFPVIRLAQTANYGYVPNPRMQNVFMSLALDLKDAKSPYGSIHPRDKENVALRLSYSGRVIAYGDETVANYKFPYPTLLSSDNGHINVTYGGMTQGDQLQVDPSKGGFEGLCGDGQWMECPILGYSDNKVTLYQNADCVEGFLPMTDVRYLWRETPCEYKQCAIYTTINALPAAPFNLKISLSHHLHE